MFNLSVIYDTVYESVIQHEDVSLAGKMCPLFCLEH